MKTIPKQLCIIILKLLWLIFQTFDNEIDDTLHKIGILGNSFGTIIDIIVDRKKKIDDLIKENPGMSKSEAKQQVGSLWSYLNPKKEMSPELLDQAKRFGEIFNTTQLSASAVAEQMGKVDDSIIRCASSMKNGEFTIKAYTKSVQGLTFAAKAGKVALQLLASAGSMIAGILIGEAISGVIKLIDNQVHVAEKAQEAMEASMAAYEKSKTELEDVNKELKSNEKLIDELLAKDHLSYTEEDELQRLKDVNEQLLIQRALLEETTENGLTQTIEKTVDAYNKKYKNGPVTNEDIDRYKRSVDGGMPLNELLVDENNIAKQIAAYEKLIEYRDKAFSSGDNKLAEKYSRQITDVNEHILTSLQEDQSKIKNLSLKPFDDLTSEAQEAFKGLSSSFEVAYKRFDPSTWNKIQLDDLFKTKKFDETKDNLSELSKAGKLTVESLSEEFPELAQAISNLDLVTSDGVSKLQSVVNQFNSESEKLKDSNVSSDPIGFDISNEETSKAIDEFQKKLSTLGSALENLKSRKLTSSDLLDLQQEFPELANETDHLDKALTDLVDNTLSNLVTYLKDAGASNELINTFRELANEAKGISTPDWSGTLSVFDTAESKMQTLAEIVDALGKSYTLTAEEARKFAEVFPDLLQKGQVTSDGLIQFNKSVIDDFINGKQIQINADRETQISQLESEKALLEGKRAAAQAALDLIAAQASGEVDGENQKNEKIAEARDRLVQHLVDLGVEEQNADAVAKELMAGNMSEYDRVVSEVSANIDSNLTDSINDASKNVNTQAGNMIDSLFKVGQQALNTAKSILSIGSENPVDAVKETLNGVGDSIKNFSPKDAASNFVKSVQDAINVNKYDSVDASVKLELDISNYTSAINEIDSQINLLKSTGNKNVDDYVKDLRDKSKKGSKNEKSDTVFDWMQQKIDLIDSQVDKLKSKIDILVGYKSKNSTTDTAIDLLVEKMDILNQMADRYSEEMNKIGLSDDYIQKIQLGTIDIEKINDEDLSSKITEYQDWFKKLQDCNNQIIETQQSIHDLNLSKLDNIINQFEQLTDIQSQMIDTEKELLSLREKSGESIEANDYTSLVEKQLALTRQNADAYNALVNEMSKLDLKQGSEEWKKYNDQLQDYKNNMISAADAIEEYKDAMTELVYKELDDFKSKMDSINGTIDTMNSLIGDTNLVDENGKLTDRGLAQVALYAQQYLNAKQEAAEYNEAIESLDDALESGLITQDEYNSMLYEYTSAQESAVLASKESRDAILSLVKEGIQAEIDAKKKLIDETKAALEAEQDLHDYQESIAEKSSNISKLERQIAALSNSTDRADIAQKLQLQQELAEAQKDLYETQYDHEMEQRKDALDKEYEAFEESKNKEMDELDSNLDAQEAAIKKYLEEVKSNYSTVYGILTQYGNEYSLSAIDSLTEPWDSSSDAANLCADAIGEVTSNIQYEIDNLDFSKLYELVDLLEQVGLNGYGSGGVDFEDISGTGKWQKGKGGRWWYGEDYDPDGNYDYASDGIYTINGKQYGFDDNGYMQTEWQEHNGKQYYFDANDGHMIKSEWIPGRNGTYYYLTADGSMAENMAIKSKDGNDYYYVDGSGKWDGKTLTKDEVRKKGYAVGYRNGTTKAKKGLNLMDEDGLGSEVIISKYGVLQQFKGGEHVFNSEQTNRLWDISKNPKDYIDNIVNQKIPKDALNSIKRNQNVNVDINIGGVLDESTMRILNNEFVPMLKKNSRIISDSVAKEVKWQLKK